MPSATPLSAPPPPVVETPPPAPEPSAEPHAEPSPPSGEPALEEPAPPEPVAPRRSPIDLITQRDVAFLVDYASSDAKAKADAQCDRESGGDLEKRAACTAKAREKFTADVLRFSRDESGKTTLKVYSRAGSTLTEVFVGAVELVEESPETVRVKWRGAGRGQRPLFRAPRDALVEVPNEYSLELEDPEHGRLRYSAKIGLVAR